ncbi:PLP-dependent aminotransferase family protein [Paenibacillus popilliae]|nr:PLP-dependent aminotransferase family protein [Paenibacillus sp. SDF0028]
MNMLELTPHIDDHAAEPKYAQLYSYIAKQIVNGTLVAGTRLPSIRTLAVHLQVSRNTVEAAYQQLIAEGYVENRSRIGLFVMPMEGDVKHAELGDRGSEPEPAGGFTGTLEREPTQPLPTSVSLEDRDGSDKDAEIEIDFRHGNVDREKFPLIVWRKLANDLFRYRQDEALQYGHRQGEAGLRRAIAQYLYQSRGVRCTPEQIVMGSGIQQLLMLICQLIRQDTRSIAMEEPGYDGARAIFYHHGFEIEPIALEAEGISVQQLRERNAGAVYVTPSHQFPQGMVMSIAKRMQLLQWANERGSIIIEDDYDGEFKYGAKPVPSLQGLDGHGRVIYVGTFSKSLLPSIRLSYMVLPPWLLTRYKLEFSAYEQTASKLHQMTMERFMTEGHWDKHLRKMRKLYQEKHSTLLTALKKEMGDRVRVIGQQSGLHIVLQVKHEHHEQQLIEAARTVGVKVYPTSTYRIQQEADEMPSLLIGFGGLSLHQIREGVERLSKVWFR